MTDYAQRASNSFNERMRLIRFRRKREKLRFWDESKLVPRWLVAVVILLFILAQVIAYIVNTQGLTNNGEIFPPELKNNPTLASLALAGLVHPVFLGIGCAFFPLCLLDAVWQA